MGYSPLPFTRPAAVLDDLLRRYGLERRVLEYQFVQRWADVVGAEAAKRSSPSGIHGAVLSVAVTDAAWAQELSFVKQQLLDRLAEIIGRGHLTDIRFFVIGALPSERSPMRVRPAQRGRQPRARPRGARRLP